MSNGYHSSVRTFLATDTSTIIGVLTESVASTGVANQHSEQVRAWSDQVSILRDTFLLLRSLLPESEGWYVLLEYELPRRQRRPDVVILACEAILVIEFKIGATSYDAAARWQLQTYCLNLRDFHAESAGRTIIPILCASEAPMKPLQPSDGDASAVRSVQLASGLNLYEAIYQSFTRLPNVSESPIDPQCWIESAYKPTPSIIEAAERLYENHGIREISHCYASNLDATTDILSAAIRDAQANRKYLICFVTGVPGAGKTLTGLNVVHDPMIRSAGGSSGIFLSGNGPLVKIVREALVQSQQRAGRKRVECEHEVTTFIQNVHQFLRYHQEHRDITPHEHIVVFDEAQRAWDGVQMARKQGIDASEASLLLEVMERFEDWGVVIALVGGGQEIFLGEAGLEEWGRAIAKARGNWHVLASPEVLTGGDSVAGHRLFYNAIPDGVTFAAEPLAHLNVGVRSFRAQHLAQWVNAVISLDAAQALTFLPDIHEFPLVVTRDLSEARGWLRARSGTDGEYRGGLVATSEDQRLRSYGIERSSAFRTDFPFDKWFLAPLSDVRSSSMLEVAASEFECQGLELDWVGVCWGGDLTPLADRSDWEIRKFRGAKWQSVLGDAERSYARNRYRVLLTRARQGMVIWVPEGFSDDLTRDPVRFDQLYDFLRDCGVPDLAEAKD